MNFEEFWEQNRPPPWFKTEKMEYSYTETQIEQVHFNSIGPTPKKRMGKMNRGGSVSFKLENLEVR